MDYARKIAFVVFLGVIAMCSRSQARDSDPWCGTAGEGWYWCEGGYDVEHMQYYDWADCMANRVNCAAVACQSIGEQPAIFFIQDCAPDGRSTVKCIPLQLCEG